MSRDIRTYSVYALRIHGQPKAEYLKVRALEGVIAIGHRVEVYRDGAWRLGLLTEAPADNTLGSILFITLAPDSTT